jgi:hypothetical protein
MFGAPEKPLTPPPSPKEVKIEPEEAKEPEPEPEGHASAPENQDLVDSIQSTRQLLSQINAALDLTVGKLVMERNSKRVRHHQRVVKHLATGQKQIQELLGRLIKEQQAPSS